MKKKVLYLSAAALLSMGFVGCIEDEDSVYAEQMRNLKLEAAKAANESASVANEAAKLALQVAQAEAQTRIAQANENLAKLEIEKQEYELTAKTTLINLQRNYESAVKYLDQQQSENLSYYASVYKNAITTLESRQEQLVSYKHNLALLKANPEDGEALKKQIEENKRTIAWRQNQIASLKKYSNYRENLEALRDEYRNLVIAYDYNNQDVVAARTVYNNTPVAEYSTSTLDQEISDDPFTTFVITDGRMSVYDDVYGTVSLSDHSDMGFDIWGGKYSVNNYVYVSTDHISDYMYVGDSIYVSYSTNYNSADYIKSRYESLKATYADGVQALEMIETMYSYYVNREANLEAMQNRLNARNAYVHKAYAEKEAALRALVALREKNYKSEIEMNSAWSVLNNADNVQSQIENYESEIERLEYSNNRYAVYDPNVQNYEDNVATLEAQIKAQEVYVDAAEKELAKAKADYEAYAAAYSK